MDKIRVRHNEERQGLFGLDLFVENLDLFPNQVELNGTVYTHHHRIYGKPVYYSQLPTWCVGIQENIGNMRFRYIELDDALPRWVTPSGSLNLAEDADIDIYWNFDNTVTLLQGVCPECEGDVIDGEGFSFCLNGCEVWNS